MQEVNKINAEFQKNGWHIVKELLDFDNVYLSEDLAQYKKNEIVVDFGFYGDGTKPSEGKFGIYLIKNNDWENWIGNFRITDKALTLSFLKFLARLDELRLKTDDFI